MYSSLLQFECIFRYGEQAGVWLYIHRCCWAKLVIEGMKDGSTSLVFAIAPNDKEDPRVVKKIPLDATSLKKPLTLRLEFATTKPVGSMGATVAAMLVKEHYTQLIGHAPQSKVEI